MAVPAASMEVILAELRQLRREVAELRRQRDRRLLSFREAAFRLGIDRARIPGLVSSGRLRSVPGPHGEPRIPAPEVERIAVEGIPQPKPARRQRAPRPANDADAICGRYEVDKGQMETCCGVPVYGEMVNDTEYQREAIKKWNAWAMKKWRLARAAGEER